MQEEPAAEELIRQAKRAIRQRMRALRDALPASARAARSAALVARLLEEPLVRSARRVALFWPMERKAEVDLRPLDAALRARGATLFYPYMDPLPGGGHRTGLRRVDDPADLAERGRGFAEPPATAPEAGRGDVDLVLVPALAASPDGHRVGWGAGFYDATLPDFAPPARALVVVFDFQLLGELPRGPGDVATSGVVTDRRTLLVD